MKCLTELLLANLWLRKENSMTLKTKGQLLLYYLDILTKLHVHYHNMVKCTQNKIHEIQTIAYLKNSSCNVFRTVFSR